MHGFSLFRLSCLESLPGRNRENGSASCSSLANLYIASAFMYLFGKRCEFIFGLLTRYTGAYWQRGKTNIITVNIKCTNNTNVNI